MPNVSILIRITADHSLRCPSGRLTVDPLSTIKIHVYSTRTQGGVSYADWEAADIMWPGDIPEHGSCKSNCHLLHAHGDSLSLPLRSGMSCTLPYLIVNEFQRTWLQYRPHENNVNRVHFNRLDLSALSLKSCQLCLDSERGNT